MLINMKELYESGFIENIDIYLSCRLDRVQLNLTMPICIPVAKRKACLQPEKTRGFQIHHSA